MRDLHSNIDQALTFGPVALTADATGASVDLLGFESAAIEIQVGIGGITFTGVNKIDFVAEHSDNGTAWSQLVDADVQGKTGITGGIILSLQTAHAAGAAYKFGYIGGKRYVRVSPDFSGTHGVATPMACLILRGRPSRAVA